MSMDTNKNVILPNSRISSRLPINTRNIARKDADDGENRDRVHFLRKEVGQVMVACYDRNLP